MSSYIIKTIGERVVLGVLLTKQGVPITGEHPTIEIRRNADGFYLDFSASSAPYWKTNGGTKEKVLPERSWMPGFYSWHFDHGLYDGTKNDYTVIYRNPLPYRLYQNEIISFNNEILFDITYLRKILTNKQTLEHLSAQHMEHVVFDDDKQTEIYRADITLDISGSKETRDPV